MEGFFPLSFGGKAKAERSRPFPTVCDRFIKTAVEAHLCVRPFLMGQGLSLFRLFRQSRKIHLPLWEGNLKFNRAAVLNKKPLS
ncbi:MAG: hypothetical protein J6C34_06080, partial [Oscillospiraceae bacterium]|nr:hypothetical protein [Oscillospiraceae bacterium]